MWELCMLELTGNRVQIVTNLLIGIPEGGEPKWYVPPPHTSAVFTAPFVLFLP